MVPSVRTCFRPERCRPTSCATCRTGLRPFYKRLEAAPTRAKAGVAGRRSSSDSTCCRRPTGWKRASSHWNGEDASTDPTAPPWRRQCACPTTPRSSSSCEPSATGTSPAALSSLPRRIDGVSAPIVPCRLSNRSGVLSTGSRTRCNSPSPNARPSFFGLRIAVARTFGLTGCPLAGSGACAQAHFGLEGARARAKAGLSWGGSEGCIGHWH